MNKTQIACVLAMALIVPDWTGPSAEDIPEVVRPSLTEMTTICTETSVLNPDNCMTREEREWLDRRRENAMISISTGMSASGFGVSTGKTATCEEWKGLLGATRVPVACTPQEALNKERNRQAVEALFLFGMGSRGGL